MPSLNDGAQYPYGLSVGPNGPFIAPGQDLTSVGGSQRQGALETIPRLLAATNAGALTSQRLQILFWTAPVSKTVNTMEFAVGGTAAAATPTLARYAIYTLSDPTAMGAALALTLAASTANDTTLFATQNTPYPKALTAPYTINAGQRYGLGVLVVSAAAMPTLIASAANVNIAFVQTSVPQMGTQVSSQSDLPATTVATNASCLPVYCALY